MSELHSASWYSAQVTPYLPPKIFKPVPSRLWWGALFLAMAIGSGLVIGRHQLPVWANILLSVPIAVGFAGLGFLGHEILHGSVVKTAWLRDLLGGIAFAQFMLGPKLWRKWHNMEHHAHTQEEHTDPDAMATMEEFFRRPGLRFLYGLSPWVRSLLTFVSFSLFFSVFCVKMLLRYYPSFRPREQRIVLLQLALPAALWLGLLMALGPVRWAFIYLLPLMAANFLVISYISTNHQLNPLTDVNDPLANSLSVTVPRWVDILNLNFSYHTEHHLFPGVNSKWAPLVKAQLVRLFPDRYNQLPMTQALLTLWRTPRLYLNRTDLVDPQRGLAYGSLGHGLDPGKVTPRPIQPR